LRRDAIHFKHELCLSNEVNTEENIGENDQKYIPLLFFEGAGMV